MMKLVGLAARCQAFNCTFSSPFVVIHIHRCQYFSYPRMSQSSGLLSVFDYVVSHDVHFRFEPLSSMFFDRPSLKTIPILPVITKSSNKFKPELNDVIIFP